jgi:hypothetical protein
MMGRGEVIDGEDKAKAIGLLQISGNFLFDPASHRDFLGVRCSLFVCCFVLPRITKIVCGQF